MSSRALLLGASTCLAVSACASTTDTSVQTSTTPARTPDIRQYVVSNDPAVIESARMANLLTTLNAMRAEQGLPTSPSADQVDEIATSVAALPLGTMANPVRAVGPTGQRAYLSRLRCTDGQRPDFHRLGSYGAGIYGRMIDGYEVTCPGSSDSSTTVFMDMYHPGYVETEPVSGFTIAPYEPARSK